MNANELLHYSQGRQEGDREREKGKKKKQNEVYQMTSVNLAF